MKLLHILKLIMKAFLNWFRTRDVSSTFQGDDGFHLYEFSGTPSVTPGTMVVKYRHTVDGVVSNEYKLRMAEGQWVEIVRAIESDKGLAT